VSRPQYDPDNPRMRLALRFHEDAVRRMALLARERGSELVYVFL